MNKKLKRTRCQGCTAGTKYGPRGGKTGYWGKTVTWFVEGRELYGACEACGGCFEGRTEYQRQLAL